MRGHVAKKYKRKKGEEINKKKVRYYPVLELDRDPDGKRRQKWLQGFSTKVEAEKYLTKILADNPDVDFVETKKQTVCEYFTKWLELKQSQIRPGTYRQYAWLVNKHIIPSLGHFELTKLRAEHIEDFYTELQANENISDRSILHAHRIIHQALDRALQREQISRNVALAVIPPRPESVEMKVWSEEQLTTFLNAAKTSRYAFAFLMLASTGMRPGELLALRWQDVDQERGKVSINRAFSYTGKGYKVEAPKTAAGRRTIDLPPSVSEQLKRHRETQSEVRKKAASIWHDEDLVICTGVGTPVLQHNLRMLFLRISERAKLTRIRMYDLRHTHATIMLSHNVHPKIVQERLGHADISVTLNTYSHVIPGLQEAAARSIDSVFSRESDKP